MRSRSTGDGERSGLCQLAIENYVRGSQGLHSDDDDQGTIDCVRKLMCMHCECYDDDGFTTKTAPGGNFRLVARVTVDKRESRTKTGKRGYDRSSKGVRRNSAGPARGTSQPRLQIGAEKTTSETHKADGTHGDKVRDSCLL